MKTANNPEANPRLEFHRHAAALVPETRDPDPGLASGAGLARRRGGPEDVGRLGPVPFRPGWPDALGHGLVDDLGAAAQAVARARSLAGLAADAPTWNVEAPKHALTPPLQEPKEAVRLLGQLLSERALLVHPQRLELR